MRFHISQIYLTSRQGHTHGRKHIIIYCLPCYLMNLIIKCVQLLWFITILLPASDLLLNHILN